jgi:hypothetical protein
VLGQPPGPRLFSCGIHGHEITIRRGDEQPESIRQRQRGVSAPAGLASRSPVLAARWPRGSREESGVDRAGPSSSLAYPFGCLACSFSGAEARSARGRHGSGDYRRSSGYHPLGREPQPPVTTTRCFRSEDAQPGFRSAVRFGPWRVAVASP